MMKKQKAPEMKKHRNVYSKGDIAFNIVNYTVFFLITLACVFPFYYLFINTISSNELVRLGKIQLYPQEIHFENYVQVMKIEGIADALLVSVARTVLGTLWTVGGCAFLGYLVTKQEMWLRKVWYRMIVITMYFSAGLIPWYMNLRMLGFLDNFWVYVIPGLVSPYNVILVKTFIEGLPPALEESATLDGAGYFRCFVSVVMPLITPILATLCIFSAVGQWNSFTDTMMLMPSGKYYTLQFLLYKYQHEAQSLAALVRTTQDSGAMDQSVRQADRPVRADDRGHGGHAAHPAGLSLFPAVFRQGHHDRRRQGLIGD